MNKSMSNKITHRITILNPFQICSKMIYYSNNFYEKKLKFVENDMS